MMKTPDLKTKRRNMAAKCFAAVLISSSICAECKSDDLSWMDAYNVASTSQSKTASESMP